MGLADPTGGADAGTSWLGMGNSFLPLRAVMQFNHPAADLLRPMKTRYAIDAKIA
jgi:hypothetical protein